MGLDPALPKDISFNRRRTISEGGGARSSPPSSMSYRLEQKHSHESVTRTAHAFQEDGPSARDPRGISSPSARLTSTSPTVDTPSEVDGKDGMDKEIGGGTEGHALTRLAQPSSSSSLGSNGGAKDSLLNALSSAPSASIPTQSITGPRYLPESLHASAKEEELGKGRGRRSKDWGRGAPIMEGGVEVHRRECKPWLDL